MAKGFNFNIDRCVACHACLVACSLENKLDRPWRMVIGDNDNYYPGLPVHNISMACNHCEEAPCMKGCPTGAYYRDELFGTVQLNPDRCIGCQYCYWNCPYDAPFYNSDKKEIEKCNLCLSRLKEGINPACVSACPTGALGFSDISQEIDQHYFVASDTSPGLSVSVSPGLLGSKPEIVPLDSCHNTEKSTVANKVKSSIYSEWSLIVFTYMTSLLFALNISNWYGITKTRPVFYLILTILTLLIPFLHLGKPFRAWKSVTGVFKSPLSNEIVSLLLFSISSVLAYFLSLNELWIVSFAVGFLMLVSVDSVYTFSDSRFSFKIHPGQSFLTGLLIASYFMDAIVPFIFVSILKFLTSIYYIYASGSRPKGFKLYTVIQAIVLSYLIAVISNNAEVSILPVSLLLISEFAGRVFYYIHFHPSAL